MGELGKNILSADWSRVIEYCLLNVTQYKRE